MTAYAPTNAAAKLATLRRAGITTLRIVCLGIKLNARLSKRTAVSSPRMTVLVIGICRRVNAALNRGRQMKPSENLKAYLILENELAPLVNESPEELLVKLVKAWYALSDKEHDWLTARGNLEERRKCPKCGDTGEIGGIVSYHCDMCDGSKRDLEQ